MGTSNLGLDLSITLGIRKGFTLNLEIGAELWRGPGAVRSPPHGAERGVGTAVNKAALSIRLRWINTSL